MFARFGKSQVLISSAHESNIRVLMFVHVAERGVEKNADLDGLSAADVEKKMADILSGR